MTKRICVVRHYCVFRVGMTEVTTDTTDTTTAMRCWMGTKKHNFRCSAALNLLDSYKFSALHERMILTRFSAVIFTPQLTRWHHKQEITNI